MRATSARASKIGARKLTSSPASISATSKSGDSPRRRQRRVGDEDVHVAAFFDQPVERGAVGEIGRRALRTELAGEWLEHVRTPAGEQQPRAFLRQSTRDRVADATGRAGHESHSVHPTSMAILRVEIGFSRPRDAIPG